MEGGRVGGWEVEIEGGIERGFRGREEVRESGGREGEYLYLIFTIFLKIKKKVT